MYKDRNYYYKILGLRPGASQVEIKSAYRRLVKLYHPDICKSADSMAMYKEVRTAYDKLSNWDYSSVTDIKTATRTDTNAGTYTKTTTKTGTGTKANPRTKNNQDSSEFDRAFNEYASQFDKRNDDSVGCLIVLYSITLIIALISHFLTR